jgi:hypothetical protein
VTNRHRLDAPTTPECSRLNEKNTEAEENFHGRE